MTTPLSDQSRASTGRLLRRLAFVFACSLAAGMAFAVLYVISPQLLPQVLALVAPTGVGLVAGFAARWTLRGQIRVLRLAAAFGAVTVALAFLGWITWGLAGVALSRVSLGKPDWGGLAELILGYGSSWLALRAWREPAPAGPAARPDEPSAHRSRQRLTPGWFSLSRLRRGLPALRLPAPLRHRRWAGERRVGRRLSIRLTGKAEDRCPFCLEVVQRRDARGVVTCPECRTRHHADCWAVTGMCQVPHHHG